MAPTLYKLASVLNTELHITYPTIIKMTFERIRCIEYRLLSQTKRKHHELVVEKQREYCHGKISSRSFGRMVVSS